MNTVGHLSIYENQHGNIVIYDNSNDWAIVDFDEALAEKICKSIMRVAHEIRERENGVD